MRDELGRFTGREERVTPLMSVEDPYAPDPRTVLKLVPDEWARPDGFTGPCPECGSTTCPGYYKPDGNHFLAF